MLHPNAKTRMTEAWIADVMQRFPTKLSLDANGNPNGNIVTCPVRASFVNIFERAKPVPPNPTGKFGTTLLFPFGADLSVLKAEASRVALAKWPQAGTPQGPTLHNPFRDQGEKQKFEGYVPGAIFLTASADKFQPYCVDQNMAPITDQRRLYPGVWVIASINAFAFDAGMKKGPTFGLNGVMVVADDENLAGGGSDPNQEFRGINIDASINPAAGFGTQPNPAAVTPQSLF